MRLRRFSLFFFFSGFCCLLYEVIWLRLGMAAFGVTTPIVSLFVSIFMGGLGLGSWAAGAWMRNDGARSRIHPLRLYALAELITGVSALTVPLELNRARLFVENYGGDLARSPAQYFALAGAWMVAILLPWTLCMGATFPLAMAAIRRYEPSAHTSFSFLYLANVLGAIAGALLPAFVLVEIFGFHDCLRLAAALNLLVGIMAAALSLRPAAAEGPVIDAEPARVAAACASPGLNLNLLFSTGLLSLAMEIVWIRQFTPYMGNEVYTFAWILGCYLLGTYIGSRIYRRWLTRHAPNEVAVGWLLLGVASLLPLLFSDPRLSDPRFHMMAFMRVALGIMPVTGLLGFVTPQLVDQYSQGDAERAGKAYAVNVAGCIIGPLLAGFLLLPWLGERWSLALLALPFFGALFIFKPVARPEGRLQYDARFYAELVLVAVALLVFTKDYIIMFHPKEIRRDYTATVLATGEGMQKQLVVNGTNLTILTPITKYMAHMPLAYLSRPPKNALVICFGMGTTHRSILSWGIDSTAVELLPSVPELFGYYHPDGPELLKSPKSHMVIDDGRLFLEKSKQQFDVITIDPPPPISAAGVSFLYSRQFYETLKPRLAPGGILQQWTTGGDWEDAVAIAKAERQAFPYVRCMVSIEGWGFHCLASMSPIPDYTPQQLASHMPPAAQADLLEWLPGMNIEQAFAVMRSHEIDLDAWLAKNPDTPPLDDDRPVNEYYLLRQDLPKSWSRALYAFIDRGN